MISVASVFNIFSRNPQKIYQRARINITHSLSRPIYKQCKPFWLQVSNWLSFVSRIFFVRWTYHSPQRLQPSWCWPRNALFFFLYLLVLHWNTPKLWQNATPRSQLFIYWFCIQNLWLLSLYTLDIPKMSNTFHRFKIELVQIDLLPRYTIR